MTSILLSIAALCIVGLIIIQYLKIRNDKVSEFRQYLIDSSCRYNDRRIHEAENSDDLKFESAYDWFLHKYTYGEMLYSFKSLKLESWYTQKKSIEYLINF